LGKGLRAIFSISGRVNRARYWLYLIAAVALFAVLMVAFWFYALSFPGAYENGGPTPFPSDPLGIVGAILWIALIVAVYVAGITMSIKRGHDRNMAWWWAVLFVLGPNALFALGQYLTTTAMAGAISYLVHILAMALAVWGFVELGCLRGTRGANRFGPDSLA
jgi:uncharacterized membrane protein YhaH (DUF805 family)